MANFDKAFETAKAEARRLVEPFASKKSKVDLDAICRAVGVTRVTEQPMLATGLLVAKKSEWHVYLKKGMTNNRKRFTVAHEVAHILLGQALGEQRTQYSRDNSLAYNQEERAADRLAGELLIPDALLRQNLVAYNADRDGIWPKVYKLSTFFGVSVSALVFRILECESLVAVLNRSKIDCQNGQSIKNTIDCSRHANVLFFERPDKAFDAAKNVAATNGHFSIKVEVLGNSIDMQVATCQRHVCRDSLQFEQWMLGWDWL